VCTFCYITSSRATERNRSVQGSLYKKSQSRLALEGAAKLIYICANLTEHNVKSEEEIMLAVLKDGRSNEDDVEIVTCRDHMST
jgi:tRNA A37 methylthiotransferase MiaB